MGVQDKNTALFAECKWTNEKIDQNVLKTLIRRSQLFNYSQVFLFCFSKSGFTQGCLEMAETLGNVQLITFAQMMKWIETDTLNKE